MLKAIDLTTIIDFESDSDPDKGTDKATKFKLGGIPSRIYAQLKDKATRWAQDKENPDSVKAEFRHNDIARDIVRFGVKGFSNYSLNFKTQPEKFGDKEYQAVADDIMDSMDINLIRELSAEIRKLSEFNEAEIKN